MKVFVIAALTADGFIGRDSGHSSMEWNSKEDKAHFVRLTKEAGTMVFGAKTFATFNRALPGRRTIVYTRQPEKITVEGVETTSEAPEELIARLEKEGAKALAVCGGASIYGLFMQAKVVTDLYLTVEPKLFGTGIPLFTTSLDAELELLEVERPNENTLFLHYAVRQSE